MFANSPYEVIGQAMAGAAPQGWCVLRVEVEAGDGYVDTGFRAEVDGARKSFVLPRDAQTRVEDALIQIREGLRQVGDPPWRQAEMVLRPDGAMTFKIKSDAEPASAVGRRGPEASQNGTIMLNRP